jgi:hypothetical protein
MPRKEWLALLAVHADTWLLSIAFYYGVKLDANERLRLFKLINSGGPTLFEVISDRRNGKQVEGVPLLTTISSPRRGRPISMCEVACIRRGGHVLYRAGPRSWKRPCSRDGSGRGISAHEEGKDCECRALRARLLVWDCDEQQQNTRDKKVGHNRRSGRTHPLSQRASRSQS